ncbi:hypothetical protein D3C81_1386440 [compost metagenome]
MERGLLLWLLRGAAPRGDRCHWRLCHRDRHRGCAYCAAPASQRLELGVPAYPAGGWPGHRQPGSACQPAHPLGARHGADLPHRQSPDRQGPEPVPALLLRQRDAALPRRHSTSGVPHRAAGVPAAARLHHLCASTGHPVVRGAAHGPRQPYQRTHPGQVSAALLGRGLRDRAGLVHRTADHHCVVQPGARQVQRHRQGRHPGR